MDPLLSLETPAVVVDRSVLEANLQAMQRIARQAGLRLRPHAKTHKCVTIARLQMALGACGLTAAKVDEALVFMHAGVPSITLAHPQVSAAKLDRLLAGAGATGCDLGLIVDSPEGLALLQARTAALGVRVGAYLKVDVGLHRCGLAADDPRCTMLAAGMTQAPGIDFRGLLSHAGHVYGAQDRQEAGRIAEEERQQMVGLAARLEAAGLRVAEISVGATPTVLAANDFAGVTEIRPGNYVFLDRACLQMGLAAESQIALWILTTVVSQNAHFAIVDAGAKTLSSDRGAHGRESAEGFGLAYPLDRARAVPAPLVVTRLSEEHGFIPRPPGGLPIGSRLRLLPNHACAVANLTRQLTVVDGATCTLWPVEAAACVR